jgi:phage tail-like protein
MSSRGLTPDVLSPHPLVDTLPGLFQEDPLVRQWTAALDELLAPVFMTLDGFAAYLDPWLAPEDFLPWLAGCVGMALDPAWPLDRRRAAVARAAELHRWRGTARGVAAAVELATGSTPEIEENGGVWWSASPTAAVPPSLAPEPAEPRLLVRLHVPAGAPPGLLPAARRAIELAVPAHVPVTLEIVEVAP